MARKRSDGFSAASARLAVVVLAASFSVADLAPAILAAEAGAIEKSSPGGKEEALKGVLHPDKCDSCNAGDIWNGFVERLKASGREDLIPAETVEEPHDDAAPTGDDPPAPKLKVDLQATDPIRGVLFRTSPDLVNLDAHFAEVRTKPYEKEELEKAGRLAEKLRASGDPYLRDYGEYYGARLDIDQGRHERAVKALEGLLKSCHFLPKRDAHRLLGRAYQGAGDVTLAVLEIQFFLVDLPPENEADRAWAREELRRIREKQHQGPLQDTEENMRSISTLVAGLDVGEGTQAKERRVEDVIDKVAKLLERMGGT